MASESKKPDQELVTKDSIRAMRRSYGEAGLSEQSAGMDPINLFHHWLHDDRRGKCHGALYLD